MGMKQADGQWPPLQMLVARLYVYVATFFLALLAMGAGNMAQAFLMA